MNHQSRIHPSLLAALAAFAAMAVYANSLANGFALDDVFIIQNNPRVHDLSNLRAIWLTPYWPWSGQELGLYRPTAIFAYAVQWAVGGGAAWIFHAVNIALHAAATVLVFGLLRRLTDVVPAFIGALVFAVHPVHTEAVANIVGQAELIAGVAVLGACLTHASRPDALGVSWPRRLVLVPLFLLALATKESTVVMPALLIAIDFAQKRIRLTSAGVARYADAMLMPMFLLAATLAAYLIVRIDVMSGSVIGVDAAPAMPYLREEHRVLNALRAFPEFLRLLFFPQELAADYLPAVIMPVEQVRPMVILGAFLLTSITAVALLTPWLPALGFPAVWFLLTIIVVSNLFFPIGVLVAERTLYLPSVAISAAVAFAWRAAAPVASPAVRRLAPAALVIVIVLFAARTWIRNPDWKDTPAVYAAMVRDHPHSYRAQWVQAMGLRLNGHVALADEHYRMALRIYPGDSQLMADYADFLLASNRPAEAVQMLERSTSIHPRVQTTAIMLAQAYLVAGRYEDALGTIRSAEELGVGQELTGPLLALVYHGLGVPDLAVAASRIAVRKGRMGPNLWSYLARNLAIGGFDGEALSAIERGRVVSDSVGVALLDRLEDAVHDGCYIGWSRGAQSHRPLCDPVPERLEVQNAMQNASGSHNATVPPPTTGGELPGDER